MQINPLIKNCFIERAYKSNNTFEKFPLEVKTHNIKEKRGSEIKDKSRKQKFNFLAKNLINKIRSKFWGVTITFLLITTFWVSGFHNLKPLTPHL